MTVKDYEWLYMIVYDYVWPWLCLTMYAYILLQGFPKKMGISEWFSVYFSAHSIEKRDPYVHVHVHTMYKIIFERYQGGEKYIFYIIGFMCS